MAVREEQRGKVPRENIFLSHILGFNLRDSEQDGNLVVAMVTEKNSQIGYMVPQLGK